ncbi:acylneuraminate cytidylyltransferase family protein [Microvirgula aerodenitrificans]|uniref:acylneuraminate cytidylyltransferase family protein n=1 Tax=Microvirgula aerodenitrificans TaxID=57480 RepID=UPI00248DC474|nr:acylneuraminate cytidylyltransferase family protein [Microvirgula aerodenitrificans]
MIQGKSVLALVPARGGSKGLPGKNVRPLLGKPLIGWSIDQGRASKYVDAVVVSTEDAVIAAVARDHCAEVPFMRPPELASDTASSIDVILHALDTLEQAGRHYDMLVLLEPTSPLRETADIDAALEALLAHADAQSIVGVAKAESGHPSFLLRRKGVLLEPYAPQEFGAKRRQELDELFFLEGTVYIAWVDALRTRRSFYHERTMPYVVPKYKSFEVDDLTDFTVIEALMVARMKGSIG